MLCESSTIAAKRFQRRVLLTTAEYLVVVLGAASIVRRWHPVGWHLYFWALLPAIPVMATIVQMARYLHEETDEYQRVLAVRSLLAGTGALLGLVVVNDFLRSFTPVGPLPPFTCFVTFFLAFGLAQAVQKLIDRTPAAE